MDAAVDVVVEIARLRTRDARPVKVRFPVGPDLVGVVHGAGVDVDDAEGAAERGGPLVGGRRGEELAVGGAEGGGVVVQDWVVEEADGEVEIVRGGAEVGDGDWSGLGVD